MLNCTCPIADCPAQPTGAFIRAIVSSPEVISKVAPPSERSASAQPKEWAPGNGLTCGVLRGLEVWHPGEPGPHLMAPTSPQYEKALLRGYVESCSNLTWCTNPQGCDRILCRQGLGCGTTCSKCGWASCFNCSFPEVGPDPEPESHPSPAQHPFLPPTHRLCLVLILCHPGELCSSSSSPPDVTSLPLACTPAVPPSVRPELCPYHRSYSRHTTLPAVATCLSGSTMAATTMA